MMERREFLARSLMIPVALLARGPLWAARAVPARRPLELRLIHAELERPAKSTLTQRGRAFLDLGADNVARFQVHFPRQGYYRFELAYGGDTLDRPPRAAVLLDRRLLGTTYFLKDHPADPSGRRLAFSYGDLGEHRVAAGPHTLEIETLFQHGEAVESLRITPIARRLDSPDFTFVQLSDTHLKPDFYPVWLNRKLDGDMAEILQDVAVHVKRLAPDFVLHTGDIVEGDSPESIAYAREVFAAMPRPLYPVLGNHDTYRRNHENWLRLWRGDFPGEEVYYSFDCKQWRVVMLDCLLNQSYALREPQLAWLADDLNAHRDRPTLLAAHTPIGGPGENPRLTSGVEPLLSIHPQIKLVLAGHTHRNFFTAHPGRFHVVVAAMVEYPMIYRRFLVYGDRIEVETYQAPRRFLRKSFMGVEEKLAYRREQGERVMEMDRKINNDMLGDNATLCPALPLSLST